MKHTLRILALSVPLVLVSCRQNQEEPVPLARALQAALDESLEGSGAVGVSAAAVLPGSKLWAGTTGISHTGVPLTTDMLFGIGSVEKNLQAAMALKLTEEGVITLDDSVGKWLPPTPNVASGIAIRQLLNMTSGIHDFVGDPNSPFRVGFVNIDFDHVWTWEEIRKVLVREPSFEPGSKCEYSSTNYIVLRAVLENATRSQQAALVETRVLAPNGLDHTVVDFSRPMPEALRVAHGWFDTDGDGTPEDVFGYPRAWITSLSPMYVYSTPTDMVKWMDALYREKTVIKEGTLKEMLAFGAPVQREPLMKGYGLGTVDIDLGAFLPRWEQVRVYGHLGSEYGYSTFVGYFPDYGVSLAIMSNRGCDAASERAIGTVGGAVIDVLLRHLGATESSDGESIADLLNRLERSPDNAHLMYRIAKQQQAANDDQGAWLTFQRILERDPDDRFGYGTEALFWKAAYDGLIGKRPEGLAAFVSEHRDYRDLKLACRLLAKSYVRCNEMDRAVGAYRNALQDLGKDPEFYNEYAWWVYENRVSSEYGAALGYAKAAAESRPEAYYIWDTVAWLYFELRQQELAVGASEKALSLAPEGARSDMERSYEAIKKGRS